MIELTNDALVFTFPEVHPEAELTLDFRRTFRIPDDQKRYPLPPEIGTFPLQHVDDFAETVPASWKAHGGVMLPMFQAEAMWISFESASVDDRAEYCFVVKIATGKVNAVTGEDWREGINRDPQDYLVVPTQPWLDGYCVEKGTIRQFVAMPLGRGYTAEEQVTGHGEVGGLQISVYPMKRKVFEQRFPRLERRYGWGMARMRTSYREEMSGRYSMSPEPDMGLSPGGKMRQEIYDDPYDFSDWDVRQRSRCFVHLTNSLAWHQITGAAPPTKPPTAKEYVEEGLPWFDYYAETPAVDGGGTLGNVLKSVGELGQEQGETPLPENPSVMPGSVVHVGPGERPGKAVREW